jgi:hypothetical protein
MKKVTPISTKHEAETVQLDKATITAMKDIALSRAAELIQVAEEIAEHITDIANGESLKETPGELEQLRVNIQDIACMLVHDARHLPNEK